MKDYFPNLEILPTKSESFYISETGEFLGNTVEEAKLKQEEIRLQQIQNEPTPSEEPQQGIIDISPSPEPTTFEENVPTITPEETPIPTEANLITPSPIVSTSPTIIPTPSVSPSPSENVVVLYDNELYEIFNSLYVPEENN